VILSYTRTHTDIVAQSFVTGLVAEQLFTIVCTESGIGTEHRSCVQFWPCLQEVNTSYRQSSCKTWENFICSIFETNPATVVSHAGTDSRWDRWWVRHTWSIHTFV